MLTLYYANNTVALAAHVVLEDVRANYKLLKIDFETDEQKSQGYTAVNPKQRVPTLITPFGLLTETTAIMLYIALEHPKMKLIPNDTYTLAEAHSFNAYLSSTVHVAHSHKRRGDRWASNEKTIENMASKVSQNMASCGNFIENHLFKGPWVLGKQYSICDPYLAIITKWLEDDDVDVSQLPKIMEHNQRIKERRSMKHVMKIHNP